MFKLVIEDDDGNKTVVPIIRDEITIGRQDGNTIRLTERNVSRRHARLVRENGSVYLEEIAARYGTRRNGERVDGRIEFGVGDVVSIGDYRLTLQSDVAPEAKKPPKKPNGAAPPLPRSEFSNQPTQVTQLPASETRAKEGTEILPADPAKLVIISSNFAGQEFPLARKEMVIGRGEDCDIIIDHRSVSEFHAKVIREVGGEYKIVDLKSKNGIKVGGEQYKAVHLKRGDIVELGHVKFRFVEPGENYIFTPQAIDNGEFSPKRGPSVLVIGGAIGLILAGLFVAYMLYSGSKTPTPQPKPVAAKPKPDQKKTATPKPPKPNKQIDALIAAGEKKYKEGKVSEAIGSLEAVRGMDGITEDQVKKLDDLIASAKREKPAAMSFQTGKTNFNQKNYEEALKDFRQIPDDDESNIYQLLKKGDYIQKSIDALLAQARDSMKSKEYDDARDHVTAVTDLYPDNEDATKMLAELDKSQRKRHPAHASHHHDGNDTHKKTNSNSSSRPKVANASDVADAAAKMLMSARWKDIIHTCKPVLHTNAKCQRLTALANDKLGRKEEACKWYKRSGTHSSLGTTCP